MELLQVSDFGAALVQLLQHGLQRNPLFDHHNREMIEQIGNFPYRLRLHAVFCGYNGLRTLLPYFFQKLIQPLIQQITGLGAFLGVALPVLHHLVEAF